MGFQAVDPVTQNLIDGMTRGLVGEFFGDLFGGDDPAATSPSRPI